MQPISTAPATDSFEARWKPRRRAIGLLGILTALILWLGNALRPCYIGSGSVETDTPLAVTTRQGIEVIGADRKRARFYLTDRAGTVIGTPLWVWRRNELCCWSPRDNAVLIWDTSGKTRSLPLPKKLIPKDNSAVSLYTTAQGFLLNIAQAAPDGKQQSLEQSVHVIYIPNDAAEPAWVLPGLRDARGSADFAEFAGRNTKGQLILYAYAESWQQKIPINGGDWIFWGYNPGENQFAFIRGSEAGLCDTKQVLWTRRSGGAYWFRGIGFTPDGNLWTSENALAHTGGVAVLAADSGDLLGWRARPIIPVRFPFYKADITLIMLLKRIPLPK